ncbi:hypothetical protein TrLO_g8635 [Triparma laevis f. longispina]|uniref:Tetratricopeptide repeat protein n=1 Tax=Triparma laevis f. longispina TaxID=1714387 RepID=A0A9W7B1N2_9STRA|nr:hypothetical protein TrLO_g8635 [Triparma laevis f. longispina]
MRPYGYSAVCKDCTCELMTRSQPCPICRKPISSFEVRVYSGSLGERGLWLTPARNIRELARNDGFNEYFQKQFNGNEATYLRWKEVFDMLEIEGGKGIYYTVRESLEQQVLRITRGLGRLSCLGKTCGFVGDFDDAMRYHKRGKEGYEEQPGRDKIEKCRDLLKRMERALGEENVVTLETLNSLGGELYMNGEYEEAIEVYERYLAGRTKVVGEDHKDALATLNNLGAVYNSTKNCEKALEYYERALKGNERLLGKNNPSTLVTVGNIAIVYNYGLDEYEKAKELYERALEGYEAQFGKDHKHTK